jgi:hypothetical protein
MEQLRRLFKAAASAPEPDIEPPSLFLEDRIIAQWRATLAAKNIFEWPGLLFRRALACACAVALLAFAWTYQELSEPPPSHVAVAEYEMQLSFAP